MVANQPESIKRVFITGATGMVGIALVEQLLSQSLEVTALARRTSSSGAPQNLRTVPGDVTDSDSLRDAVSETDVVLHLAAKTPGTGVSDSEFETTNVRGTTNIINECTRAGKRLVFVSTVNVELFRQNQVDDPYSRSKSRAEQNVTDAMSDGLDAVIIRPAYIFGNKRGYAGRLVDRILSSRINVLPAADRLFCPVFVGDVANAIWLAATKADTRSTHTVAGERVTIGEFASTISRAIGSPPPRMNISMRIAGIPLSILWALHPITRWTPPLTLSALKTQAVFDGTQAALELGFEYRTVEQLFDRVHSNQLVSE